MRAYPHSFQGSPWHPHYPQSPHFGYEQDGVEGFDLRRHHHVGDLSDVTLPGMIFPPFGVAQALSSHGSASSSRLDRPSGGSGWSTVALLAVLVGSAAAVFAIYKITKASAPISEKAGEGVTRLLAARYGGGGGGGRALPARRTILPPEPRVRALPAPRSQRPYTLRALPEYEGYK